jgi:hypothetical protein
MRKGYELHMIPQRGDKIAEFLSITDNVVLRK